MAKLLARTFVVTLPNLVGSFIERFIFVIVLVLVCASGILFAYDWYNDRLLVDLFMIAFHFSALAIAVSLHRKRR